MNDDRITQRGGDGYGEERTYERDRGKNSCGSRNTQGCGLPGRVFILHAISHMDANPSLILRALSAGPSPNVRQV